MSKSNTYISMNCGCPKVWIRLTEKDIEYLNISSTKLCINGHYMPVFFVHDDDGDYYAPKTICRKECDGKYIYFCTKCKNIQDTC
jgi:hypothetical protein